MLSFIELLFSNEFCIFWAIIYFLYPIYAVFIYFWRILLFMLYCYRAKLLLNIENQLLRVSLEKSKQFKKISILSNLNRLNLIHCEINYWNKIWSKFIAISLPYFSFSIGLCLILLYFGKSNIDI